MTAYLAASLVALRNEVNARWPHRDKRSDGWIGDVAHQHEKSEHNPDAKGCVHAIDVDVDGIDPMALVRECVGDPRVWYVIYNRVIWSRSHGPWTPRVYTGASPHTDHVHISIQTDVPSAETDTTPWFATHQPPPQPPKPSAHAHQMPVLKVGSHGPEVKYLQQMIGAKPYDGVFGPRTAARVRWYQRLRHLTVDGVVGPKTWAEIAKMR